jgi:sulfur relay (sulfurtransferase) DsrF/TusC family protein
LPNRICMIIRRAPYGTIHAAEAARHINGALSNGLETVVVLVEDGVHLARNNQRADSVGWTSLSDTIVQAIKGKNGSLVKLYLHDESARSRGLAPAMFIEGVTTASEEEIAGMIAEAPCTMIF